MNESMWASICTPKVYALQATTSHSSMSQIQTWLSKDKCTYTTNYAPNILCRGAKWNHNNQRPPLLDMPQHSRWNHLTFCTSLPLPGSHLTQTVLLPPKSTKNAYTLSLPFHQPQYQWLAKKGFDWCHQPHNRNYPNVSTTQAKF